MTKWEYRVEVTEVGGFKERNLDKMTNGWLNNIGRDGWELVTINTTNGVQITGDSIFSINVGNRLSSKQCYLVFKRPVE